MALEDYPVLGQWNNGQRFREEILALYLQVIRLVTLAEKVPGSDHEAHSWSRRDGRGV